MTPAEYADLDVDGRRAYAAERASAERAAVGLPTPITDPVLLDRVASVLNRPTVAAGASSSTTNPSQGRSGSGASTGPAGSTAPQAHRPEPTASSRRAVQSSRPQATPAPTT